MASDENGERVTAEMSQQESQARILSLIMSGWKDQPIPWELRQTISDGQHRKSNNANL